MYRTKYEEEMDRQSRRHTMIFNDILTLFILAVAYVFGHATMHLEDTTYPGPQEEPLPPGCVYATQRGWNGGRYVEMRVPVCAGQPTPPILLTP